MSVYIVYLLFLCIPTCIVDTLLYPLDDTQPALSSDNHQLRFYEGGPAFLLASNSLIRVNYRGIRVLQSATIISNILDKGWSKTRCIISSTSLCTTQSLDNVFPFTSIRIGNTPTASHCTHSTGKMLVPYPVYDISACDILDESMDVFYYDQHIYTRYTPIPVYTYWFLIICCIFFVRSVSLNIMNKLDHSVVISQYQTVILIFAMLLVILVNGDAYYITEDDNLFYWLSISYICISLSYRLYFVYIWWKNNYKYLEPRILNLCAVCIQLIFTRLYGSAETPYAIAIIGIISARIWEKEYNPTFLNMITGLIDCMYISLLITMGYSYDIVYLFPVFMVSKLVADRFFVFSNSLNPTLK